jgi:hypothetical protein
MNEVKRFLATSMALSVLMVSQSGFAATVELDKSNEKVIQHAKELTENYKPKFVQGDYQKHVNFGVLKDAENKGVTTLSFKEMAEGETNVEYYDSNYLVTSEGITEGKGLTIVTSATTSLWNGDELKATGEKDIGLGYVDAVSVVSETAPRNSGFWYGITVHTATDGFDFYEAQTKDQIYAY